MDNYQAVYDAIRSRFPGVNAHEAITQAIRDMNLAHYVEQAMQTIAYDAGRPSVLYRPQIALDGNQWCALYGANLHDGVAGFGKSPGEAMSDFDKNWHEKIASRPDSRVSGSGCEPRQEG